MDRYEVPIDDHLRPLVEAAEQGQEVVITRDGREVARVAKTGSDPASPGQLDLAALARMQERIRAIGVQSFDATDTIRQMRDEGY